MKYMMMTGLLTLVYAALVLVTTQVLRLRTPAAVATVTVAAALLFNLPRRRLQQAVRQRYHRPA
jgi:hypothetical protein